MDWVVEDQETPLEVAEPQAEAPLVEDHQVGVDQEEPPQVLLVVQMAN